MNEPHHTNLNPFTLFRADNFKQVKAENPDKTIPQLKKLLTDRWNNLDAATKASYEKKAEEVKKSYQGDVEVIHKVYKAQEERGKAKNENAEGENKVSNPL